MSNMISNSSGVNVSAMTWPLAPEPLEEEISNTSITVSITLKEKHRYIVSLKIKVRICIYNNYYGVSHYIFGYELIVLCCRQAQVRMMTSLRLTL